MKNSTFKLLATFLLTLLIYTVNAQQTICVGEVKEYAVDQADGPNGTTGSTYVWTVTPTAPATYAGTITNVAPSTSGHHVQIDWGTSSTGTYTISVVETSVDGCETDPPQTFTVTITQGPDVTLVEEVETPICDLADAAFNITGTPNATVTYTLNGGATQTIVLDGTGNGIVDASGETGPTITILIISVANGTCTNSTTITDNTATITVNAAPTTSPIIALP